MATRRQAPRRARNWARQTTTENNLVAGDFVCNDLLSAWDSDRGATAHGGMTVARILLDLRVAFVVTGGVSFPDAHLTVGIRRDLPGADVSPFVSPHADWMFWRDLHGGSGGLEDDQAAQLHVDLGAMRRLQESEETLLLCVAYTNLTETASTASVGWSSSTLILMP